MKAITRKEQFLSAIAGEIEAPEPRTREEVYMKKISENGSGGGGLFVVNLSTTDGSNFTKDKTFNEIKEAYMNGMFCVLRFTGMQFYLDSYEENTGFMFYALNCTSDPSACIYECYIDKNDKCVMKQMNVSTT